MNAYKDTHETRIALLEQSIYNINETMLRFEKRFDKLEEKMDEGFKSVNARIDNLDSKMWTNFRWIIAIHLASIVGLVGIMANGFKWFHS